MKVVEVTKKHRSGEHKHIMLIDSDSDDVIDDAVRYWVEQDPSGQVYGYSWEWVVITDPMQLKQAYIKELDNIDSSIIYYKHRKEKVKNLLKEL